MIREPYGVVPYNTTIDTTISNSFSLIFNGDELESYQYGFYENNQSGNASYPSAKIDNPNIYNNDTLTFKFGDSGKSSMLGKNWLWNITLFENNASLKKTNYKTLTRTTTEVAPTTIYLQDESALLDFTGSGTTLTASNIIANITIRGERRRIIAYNATTNAATINEKFSFTPTYGGTTDEYIIYTNYNKSGTTVTPVITATIPVLSGLVGEHNITTENTVETGIIPILNDVPTSRYNNVVVNLDIGGGVVRRVSNYTRYEYTYSYTKSSISGNEQLYTVNGTKVTYANGGVTKTTTTLAPITNQTYAQVQNYKNYSTATVTLSSPLPSVLAKNTSFTIYRNYYDTNYYFFRSRKNATITFDNWPTVYANAFPSRYYNFIASYQQANNIPIKYHIWQVYDITKSEPIYETDKIFDSDLQFSYDNFESYHTYKINLIIVNQDDAKIEQLSPQLIVLYDPLDFMVDGEAVYNEETYSCRVLWPDNRLSIPVLVDGQDATFNYFFDYIRRQKPNARLELGTHYRYDNLSGSELLFDSTNFLFSTFMAIDDPSNPLPWNGEILNLSSTTADNKIALVKNEYKLQIICSDGTSGGSVTYDFSRNKKMTEGNFIDLKEPFSLLTIDSGEQQGKPTSPGVYRPLTEDEKNGYAYYWLDKNPNGDGTDLVWKDPYFWTETTANTNGMVYKLLIYPDRAELYPMLRWVGTVKVTNGTKITLGINPLLAKRQADTVIMIGDETRKIIAYDINTGIATIDSAFTSSPTGKTFMCYYQNGTNSAGDNLYVCKFTQRNHIPFNRVSLYGRVEYYYMTLYNTYNFKASEIYNMLDYYFVQAWTKENQSSIIINATFDNSLTSQYYPGISSPIVGFRIYRNTYKNPDDLSNIESLLIADVPYSELTIINNTMLYIDDYSVRNRGIFDYSVLPLTNTVVGVTIGTNKVATDWYEWVFTSLGRVHDNVYRAVNQWVFKLDLEAGIINHNIDKVFYRGFSQYPKASVGRTNYITTSLQCYVSYFSYKNVLMDDFLLKVGSGKITASTTDLDNRRIYIQPTTIFDDVDLNKAHAYIFINKQQRRITGYGEEGVGVNKKFFVLIESPFLHFMPNINDPLTNSYTLYTDYLPEGYDEDPIVIDRGIEFDDSIERIDEWNKFIAIDEPILVRDMKGRAFIAVLHDNTEQSDIRIDDFPTKINFNMTQIADVHDYLIFNV